MRILIIIFLCMLLYEFLSYVPHTKYSLIYTKTWSYKYMTYYKDTFLASHKEWTISFESHKRWTTTTTTTNPQEPTWWNLSLYQCYWYWITKNIGDSKNLYKVITKTIMNYGRNIAVKNYNTTTYNFNEKIMILCLKIQLIIKSYQSTINLKFKIYNNKKS